MLRQEIGDVISKSEEVRAQGDFAEALAIAKGPLTAARETIPDDEFATLSKEQLANFASLARLVVSTSDSLAKRSIDPRQASDYLFLALSEAVEPLYQNPAFITALEGIETDAVGDKYSFLLEMMRDKAKLLTTAALLFPTNQAQQLQNLAEDIWRLIENSLAEVETQDHPEKPFMFIEHQLFLAATGQRINTGDLLADLKQLDSLEKNDHRVATVAAWVMTLAKQYKDQALLTVAKLIFEQRSANYPELQQGISRKEQLKGRFKAIMVGVRRVFVPFRVPVKEKNELFSRLMKIN